MKSQVNALLHVTGGICKDAYLTYPELKESLSKDLDRLTLYSQSRGLGFFTLDLPHLESLLLEGLETGRLRLEGPLTKVISSKAKVPRLFSGLWLRIFEKSSCLKHEVDVNALFFLRQLLVIGKRIEVDCSDDRRNAKVGEYHDIERALRSPSFCWDKDELRFNRTENRCPSGQRLPARNRSHNDCDLHDLGRFLCSVPQREAEQLEFDFDRATVEDRRTTDDHMLVHLVQAVDHAYPLLDRPNDLFYIGTYQEERKARVADVRLLDKIQKVADLIFSTFDQFDPVRFSGQLEEKGLGVGFKHGPGAVAERRKNHEKSRFTNWPLKLQNVFPWEKCGKTAGSTEERPSYHEMASRLICVPKTAKGPRLIAAEPTSHQWCQQLLLRFLFDQCRGHFGVHFIDFKDQNKSGSLVLEASLDKSLATVDLSDASDRLTCWTVERMFRTNKSLLHALHAARTRYIRDEVSDVTNFLSLRKFASQGTATTFPVMSLVMLCIALGASLNDNDNVTWTKLKELRTRVRVFGDDIILPKHGYGRLVRAMDLLQLKVNVAKSYVHGHFRESCGTDGFAGFNVTPAKPRTLIADSPASCQAVVDTSNNLFNKGLWNASVTATDLLPLQVRKHLRVVGRNEAGFSGLFSHTGGDERHLRTRWNSRLHRDEVRVWSIQTRTQRSERGGFDGLLDFFAREYNLRNPRVVSESVDLRRTISRLSWEPQNSDARSDDRPRGQRPVLRMSSTNRR
nr:MAG: hypothetical protein 3 [Leviviridae sp.]